MNKNQEIALSTIDNPYNPLEEFSDWYWYDQFHGHKTCEVLALNLRTSDQLSDYENKEEIESVIDSIIANDVTGLYVKVVSKT